MKINVITFLLMSSAAGCSSITTQQQTQWIETAPICFNETDCKTKWAAARQWIQSNSGYKIQIYSDDLIETYNPQEHDTNIAVSVSKNPLYRTPEGDHVHSISIKAFCRNVFGCFPSINDSILSFNNFVSQAENNDLICYTSTIGNASKPRLGFYITDYNNKAIVKRVCKESPVSKAGMKVNDVITRISNKHINNQNDISDATNDIKFGETIEFVVLRNKIPQTLHVQLPLKKDLEKLVTSSSVNDLSNNSSIETKLDTLNRLLQKGMITQEQFDDKRDKLLDEI